MGGVVCPRQGGVAQPREDGDYHLAGIGRSAVALQPGELGHCPSQRDHNFHKFSVESGGVPYWRVVAQLAVIQWSLVAHANS